MTLKLYQVPLTKTRTYHGELFIRAGSAKEAEAIALSEVKAHPHAVDWVDEVDDDPTLDLAAYTDEAEDQRQRADFEQEDPNVP